MGKNQKQPNWPSKKEGQKSGGKRDNNPPMTKSKSNKN
jgi:hypothetical protein